MTKSEAPRKERAPARPKLAAAPSVSVGAPPPAEPDRRRSRWNEFLATGKANPGTWIKYGPLYRETAQSASRRLKDLCEAEDIEARIEVRATTVEGVEDAVADLYLMVMVPA